MTFIPRDYQSDSVEAVFAEFDRGRTRTMVHMATGLGKTVVGAMISKRWVQENHGSKILFMVHRDEILRQNHKKVLDAGLRSVVEMGMEKGRKKPAQVILGSVQTLQGDRLQDWPRDSFGLIISDECHRIYTRSQLAILNHFDSAKLVGLTATPGRSDGKRLGDIFQSTAYSYGITRATKDGWLAPLKEFVVPINVDIRGLSTSGGEYNVGDIAERIGPMIERIARCVSREIGERQTIVFTPDVGSAQAISQVLNELGTASRYVAGTGGVYGMSKKERRQLIKEYEYMRYQVIVCCDLLGEGWDNAATECVVNARPTRSPFAYAQRVGRGTRVCPEIGKKNCLVLDLDWQADEAHRIYDIVDLYSDDLDVPLPVMAKARVKEKIHLEATDIMEAIKEADEWCRTRPNLGITLTGAMPEYSLIERNPAGMAKILGMKWSKSSDERHLSGKEPAHVKERIRQTMATSGQKWVLREMGVSQVESLSKWGASKLIKEMKGRQEKKMGTVEQIQELVTMGLDPDLARAMSAREAKEALANFRSVAASQFDDNPF